MDWKKLTDTQGQAVFVNLDKVAHITAEQPGTSWIMFADRGSGIGTIAVREAPSEILKGLTVR